MTAGISTGLLCKMSPMLLPQWEGEEGEVGGSVLTSQSTCVCEPTLSVFFLSFFFFVGRRESTIKERIF